MFYSWIKYSILHAIRVGEFLVNRRARNWKALKVNCKTVNRARINVWKTGAQFRQSAFSLRQFRILAGVFG